MDDLEDEVELEVTTGGRYARITHTTDSPPTVFFEFLDRTVGHATHDEPIPFEVGAVVIVYPTSIRLAPVDAWDPEPQIAVVRLKLDDITIIDAAGRWMQVPTVDDVDYERGNTVLASP